MICKLDESILNIIQTHYKFFFSKPNVHAIGLGYKFVKGINTCEPCIHVLVTKKVSANCLPPNGLIPPKFKCVKTDVIESGIFIAANDCPEVNNSMNPVNQPPYTFRKRPIKPGFCMSVDMSASRPLTLTGTFGYIATDNTQTSNTYCILSVNKTFADLNAAPIGNPIIQPSRAYGGVAPQDVVAKLLRFTPLKFTPNMPNSLQDFNTVDCSLASYVPNGEELQLIDPHIPEMGIPRGPIIYPSRNMPVQWTGCASGHTTGVVNTLAAIAKIAYQNNQFAWFKDIFLSSTSAMANLQDYGALVCDQQLHPIGLFFGFASGGNVAICDIRNVTQSLDVTLLTV